MQLLTRQDASRMLGISVCTLGRLIARGDLEAFKVGAQVRISPDALVRYLEGRIITGKDSSYVTANDSNSNTGTRSDADTHAHDG